MIDTGNAPFLPKSAFARRDSPASGRKCSRVVGKPVRLETFDAKSALTCCWIARSVIRFPSNWTVTNLPVNNFMRKSTSAAPELTLQEISVYLNPNALGFSRNRHDEMEMV